jgi:DNA-binding protein YbaB
MFDKLQQGKNLLKMRSQAKKLQAELEEVEHTEEKGDTRIKVNGAQKIIYIEINGEERKDLVDLINKAMKGVQKKAAKKMMESGGGLGGLLGGM